MQLEKTTTVYGHQFSLNVAVKQGLDWTGKAPKWVHFCHIELGDDQEQAQAKAATIKAAMGDDYKCTLRASPKVASYSEDL
ncbi:hypothetical protein [Pseudomonas phage COT4]|uniref:Uncharacterized protein n=1 Tax=Pseudomonas phage M5.1 TaxID=2873460 RepID=A0AAE9BNM7_9CAUD|nr:hypothetical protein QGX13_gp052 [Pseudomonas phage M5.1]UAV89771.1 hypothetical protein M51_190 [Pseudomonas phage M5.1]UGL61370.1 hypothetical protein [Pseudomonas phage COT4]